MESRQEDEDSSYKRFRKIVKKWIACLASVSISMVGGLILTWWDVSYHPTNSQQWMVPLGLILVVTPVMVCIAVLISDVCGSGKADDSSRKHLPENSLHDLEQ